MIAVTASYGMTDTMGFLGIGNNPMVACAVDVATALNK